MGVLVMGNPTGFKTITTIQHPTDPIVNRLQAEINAKVNPVLRSLPQDIPPQVGQLNQSATLLASVTPANPVTTVTGTTTDTAVQSLIAVLVKHGFIVDGTT